jgi:hypothetical protein
LSDTYPQLKSEPVAWEASQAELSAVIRTATRHVTSHFETIAGFIDQPQLMRAIVTRDRPQAEFAVIETSVGRLVDEGDDAYLSYDDGPSLI